MYVGVVKKRDGRPGPSHITIFFNTKTRKGSVLAVQD